MKVYLEMKSLNQCEGLQGHYCMHSPMQTLLASAPPLSSSIYFINRSLNFFRKPGSRLKIDILLHSIE